jgi:hypothetical protein
MRLRRLASESADGHDRQVLFALAEEYEVKASETEALGQSDVE